MASDRFCWTCVGEIEKHMKSAAKHLEVEEAAQLRDRIKELRAQQIYKTYGNEGVQLHATLRPPVGQPWRPASSRAITNARPQE